MISVLCVKLTLVLPLLMTVIYTDFGAMEKLTFESILSWSPLNNLNVIKFKNSEELE